MLKAVMRISGGR